MGTQTFRVWSQPENEPEVYFEWQGNIWVSSYFTADFCDKYTTELIKYCYNCQLAGLAVSKEDLEQTILTLTHFFSIASDNYLPAANNKVFYNFTQLTGHCISIKGFLSERSLQSLALMHMSFYLANCCLVSACTTRL